MYNYTNYMQMMGIPSQYYPMMNMPQDQLESMYPQIYNVIYPQVKHHCDMYDAQHGMVNPTKQQIDDMAEDIYNKVDNDVDMLPQRDDERQFIGYGRRPFLKDLISILLIKQMLGRRPPCYGYGCQGYVPYPTPYGNYPMSYDNGYGPYNY